MLNLKNQISKYNNNHNNFKKIKNLITKFKRNKMNNYLKTSILEPIVKKSS